MLQDVAIWQMLCRHSLLALALLQVCPQILAEEAMQILAEEAIVCG
jgi:hypothetical protein